MSDLLSEEERSALLAPYDSGLPRPDVVRAEFPSVSQLDADRAAAFVAALRRWLDPIAHELSRQVRVTCTARAPRLQTVARPLLPAADEEPCWGAIQGLAGGHVLITMPRAFAASICERIFGAPFERREDRPLAPTERSLLREMIGVWMESLTEVWPGQQVLPCPPPEQEEGSAEQPGAGWLRCTGELLCGPVEGSISISMAPTTAFALLGMVPTGGSELPTPTSMLRRVGDAPVELRAVLGQTAFTLDELSSLQIGDVIALDRKAEDPVDILLGDRPFCRARAGLAGQLVAVELIADIEGGNEA